MMTGVEQALAEAAALLKREFELREKAERRCESWAKRGRPKIEWEVEGRPELFDPAPDLLGRFDIRLDIEWVYLNMGVLAPVGPPTAGAVPLLTWARDHQHEFYTMMVPKVMASKRDLEEAAERDDGRALGLLDAFLTEKAQAMMGGSNELEEPAEAEEARAEGAAASEGSSA